jgi:transposase
MEPRKVLEAIFYILRTGIQWKALPKSMGSSSAVHRYFRFWCEAGFFQALWRTGLAAYEEAQGIPWTWLIADGCMSKAPLAREAVGSNPTDREKNGSKRPMLVDGAGASLVVTGAKRHDVSPLEHMLDALVIAGWDSFACPRIWVLTQDMPGNKARRWVVEAAHSWINRFCTLLVRFEKRKSSYLGLLMFACAFIAFRKADVI